MKRFALLALGMLALGALLAPRPPQPPPAEAHTPPDIGAQIIDTAGRINEHLTCPGVPGAIRDACSRAPFPPPTAGGNPPRWAVPLGTTVRVAVHVTVPGDDAPNGSLAVSISTSFGSIVAVSRDSNADGHLDGPDLLPGTPDDGALTPIPPAAATFAHVVSDFDGGAPGLCNDPADTCIDNDAANNPDGIAIFEITSAAAGLAVVSIGPPPGPPATTTIVWTFPLGPINVTLDAPHVNDLNGDGGLDPGEVPSIACTTSAGQCTLRAAIFNANSLGDFPKTITVPLNFPIAIGSPLMVGPGFGASPDNLSSFTVIDSAGLGNTEIICSGPFPAFMVTSAQNIIRNQVIWGCGVGVLITGPPADSNIIHRNRIGTDSQGIVPAPAPTIVGVAIVGGPDNNLLASNLISNTTFGVAIVDPGSTGNRLRRNSIGTNAAGTAAIPNAVGVVVATAPGTSIGAPTTSANIISGNWAGILLLEASSTLIQNNCIGTQGNCLDPLPNTHGILVTGGSTDNVIGAPLGALPAEQAGMGNTIRFNLGNGVTLFAQAPEAPIDLSPLRPLLERPLPGVPFQLQPWADLGGVDNTTMRLNILGDNGAEGYMCDGTIGTGPGPCSVGVNDQMVAPTISFCGPGAPGFILCAGLYTAGPNPGTTIDVYRAEIDAWGAEGGTWLCTATTLPTGAWSCEGPGVATAMSTATATGPLGADPFGPSTSEFGPAVIGGGPPLLPPPSPAPKTRPIGPPVR